MTVRTAVVTGGASGIGRATVEEFLDHGYQVFYLDQVPCTTRTSDARFIRADVALEADVEKAFGIISSEVSGIDVLVSNAAVCQYKSLADTEPAEWDRIMAVNVKSIYLVTRAAYPLLKSKAGAAIVNVASVHAQATSKCIAAYAASKGAVVALTRAMSLEMSGDGIRVNCVLPGAIDTPMLRAGVSRNHPSDHDLERSFDRLARSTPLARVGKPEEIAKAIFFLASAETGSFITGQTLIVDGGALARLSTE